MNTSINSHDNNIEILDNLKDSSMQSTGYVSTSFDGDGSDAGERTALQKSLPSPGEYRRELGRHMHSHLWGNLIKAVEAEAMKGRVSI